MLSYAEKMHENVLLHDINNSIYETLNTVRLFLSLTVYKIE